MAEMMILSRRADEIVTDPPDGPGISINGFGPQAVEFSTFEMFLIILAEMGIGWHGAVHCTPCLVTPKSCNP
ncbi:MAG: hypothetical protein JKP90_23275 [Desulfofustis sp. PB-SRB1]|jgi:hypothetical protein|nr:hypothetical protein [Desulfofustis sp. PB-SRB1]MBL0382469.1 hypothetical protein [Desulfofustis sp. PB-SRB1]